MAPITVVWRAAKGVERLLRDVAHAQAGAALDLLQSVLHPVANKSLSLCLDCANMSIVPAPLCMITCLKATAGFSGWKVTLQGRRSSQAARTSTRCEDLAAPVSAPRPLAAVAPAARPCLPPGQSVFPAQPAPALAPLADGLRTPAVAYTPCKFNCPSEQRSTRPEALTRKHALRMRSTGPLVHAHLCSCFCDGTFALRGQRVLGGRRRCLHCQRARFGASCTRNRRCVSLLLHN